MAKRDPLTADEAEALFSTVDETGHANAATAEAERRSRQRFGVGYRVDPLSGNDPSGSNVGTVMARASIILVLAFIGVIFVSQLIGGSYRRNATAELSRAANLQTVTEALRGGVEWGSGFTQFPQDFTIQEADEATGRIEVSVIDTAYADEMEVMASSQIQATALAVNCLMNPNITTVVYKVNVHVDDNGQILSSTFFDFLEPTGQVKPLMTFTWTKTSSATGAFDIQCNITGIDAETADRLRDRLGTLELALPYGPQPQVGELSGNDSEY